MTDETAPRGAADPTAAPTPPAPIPPPPPPPAPPPPPPPPPPPAPTAAGWAAPPPPPGAQFGARFGVGPGVPATPPPAGAPGWAPPPPAIPVAATPQWRSLSGLTNAITVFLGLAIAGAVFSIIAFANRISVADDILNGRGDFDLFQRADDADDLVKAAGAIYGLVALVLFVLVVIWTFRAMKNNEALGRAFPRFKPGWGIAGWLIPLANFVIPVLILQDLWRGSDAQTTRGDTTWRSNRGSPLIGWYWAAFLVSNLVRLGGSSTNDDELSRQYFDDIKSQDWRFLAGSVVAIAAAGLGILVFRRIAQRQEDCLRAQQQAWGV